MLTPKLAHDTNQGECFFVITAEASFAVKQHLYKKQPYDA